VLQLCGIVTVVYHVWYHSVLELRPSKRLKKIKTQNFGDRTSSRPQENSIELGYNVMKGTGYFLSL
jgi:hypothetical protein